ncbi:hypothetical protein Taro_055728 [Colocasia esculenta]|uniref:Poor homologous synapsis 1 PH domain-containing protein n=1 Tax=Colocasia esculenta TaxID=4460 RepID=A0A843XU91_COLES|nr:hypothetical protein [Colocasia esculenta]
MVGAVGADTLMAVERAGAPASDVAWEEKWEVEYSRFFNFPSRSSYSYVSLGLKPLPKAKASAGGTWLTASSTAVLNLDRPRPGLTPVLSVRVVGRMLVSGFPHSVHRSPIALVFCSLQCMFYFPFGFCGAYPLGVSDASFGSSPAHLVVLVRLEEHFISNLNILWPQVSCTSESPNRGSRVLLFSYINVSNKASVTDAQMIQWAMDFQELISHARIQPLLIWLLQTEFSKLSYLCCTYFCTNRNGEESSFSRLAAYASELPVSASCGVENKCPQQQLLASDIDVYSPLPPSFTELMNGCSTEPAQGTPAAEGGPADQNIKKCMSNSSLNAVSVDEVLHAVGRQVLVGNVDLRSQIEKYMSDASFNDMLATIETVIDELGGDLSL